jgi:hypothetical protein
MQNRLYCQSVKSYTDVFMNFWAKLVFMRKMALRLFRNHKTYFSDKGWYRSVVTKIPHDANGNPLPIYPYCVIDFLEPRLGTQMDIFEFGSGYSTLFYQSRVGTVTSVEHHAGWHKKISAEAATNTRVIHCPIEKIEDYISACKNSGKEYDMIIVDGRERVECAFAALDYLKPDGVIIWDDSDRPRYQDGLKQMTDKGFRRLDFYGLKATSWEGHQTTIFYRPDNCLNI